MVTTFKGLQSWLILLKLPPAVVHRELAMKQWEKALKAYNGPWEEFMGCCYSFVWCSTPHLDNAISFKEIEDERNRNESEFAPVPVEEPEGANPVYRVDMGRESESLPDPVPVPGEKADAEDPGA